MRALFVALLACVAACTPRPPVDIEYSASTDFSKYRTYGWAERFVPQGMNPELYERLRTSLDKSLTAHGFVRADPPQFSVEMVLLAEERVQIAGSGVYGGEYGYSSWGPIRLWSSIDYQKQKNILHRATLVVIIYDATSNAPIWRGSVSKQIIPADLTPQTVDGIVDAALAQFPPNIRCTQTATRYEVCNF